MAWPDLCPHGIRTSEALPILTVLSVLCELDAIVSLIEIIVFVNDPGTASPASSLHHTTATL